MKLSFLTLLGVTFIALNNLDGQTSATSPAATAPAIPAPTAAREETTGTITDVTPERSLVLHTGTNAGEPLVFRFAPKVTYVDADGAILEAPALRKNLRVRVAYVKTGGENTIDRLTILE